MRLVNGKKGFTLVEVIVVAVIVAVLAAVAIPLYMGYLDSTRQQSVDQLAQAASAAADGYFRKTGADPSLPDLNLKYDNAQFTVSVGAGSVTVTLSGHAGFTKTVPYR
jgi:prepilin-type N-terminal cleavage/methylation domain-containing protein